MDTLLPNEKVPPPRLRPGRRRARFWVGGLLLAALAMLLGNATASATPAPAQRLASGWARICNGDTIPSGWVITSVSFDARCSGPGLNSAIIEQPQGSWIRICNGSPIPSGWVITSVSVDTRCGGPGRNSAMIELPQGSWIRICNGSPIPSGWVITSVSVDTSCDGPGSNSAIIERR